MTMQEIEKREQRLKELAEGFGREVCLWKNSTDPLLPHERRAYLNAIQDAIVGLDDARAMLTRARRRIADAELAAVRPTHVVPLVATLEEEADF